MEWDETWVRHAMPLLSLISKGYFRSDVQGMEKVPDGGALLISNHSGGLLAFDVPLITVAFADHFGPARPLYTLAHDILFQVGGGALLSKFGFLRAHPRNAVAALESGAATLVFPGGDWDVMRPSRDDAKIDFGGRTGYIRTALQADVPIVPIVTIGAQETQWFLTRGEGLATLLRLDKLLRIKGAPLSLGFPFGLTAGLPANVPLPSKMTTRVLDPIDIRAEFGTDPDIAEVDQMIRKHMQHALDDLARKRRFPVLG
ncbi:MULTISPECIES: lysophospholipid acyltransferase family protein [unclassified Gordonia (in: high G+C Gram-positive bacteria)]